MHKTNIIPINIEYKHYIEYYDNLSTYVANFILPPIYHDDIIKAWIWKRFHRLIFLDTH